MSGCFFARMLCLARVPYRQWNGVCSVGKNSWLRWERNKVMNWRLRELGWRLLPGGIAVFLTAVLLKLGGWQPFEQMAYRMLFQSRGALSWTEQVVAIGIDDASLAAIGRFPWSRQQYVALIDYLTPADPSVIVFDLIFSEPSPEDEGLAIAMQKQGRVVIAQAWNAAGSPLLPQPSLAEAAIATGHILKYEDEDGISRQILPQIQGIPFLALVAAQVHSLVKEPVPLPSLEQSLWVNWPGPTAQVPHYSFAAVLQEKIPLQTFKDKIVLVGVTADGLVDAIATPYDRNPHTSGVYLHAAAIDNLLEQRFLQRPSSGWWLLPLGLVSLSFSFIVSRWRISHQMFAGMGLCSGWWVVGSLLFRANYWLPIIWPVGLFSLTLAALILLERVRVGASLKKLYPLWQLHHKALAAPLPPSDRHFNTDDTDGVQPSQQSVLMQSIIKLANLTEILSRLATVDGLTRIANRYAFDRSLELEWRRAQREQQSLSLILCDVDFFKRYNDTYGHQAGDRCLQQVATVLRQSAKRPADLTARYGGEEFAVILPNTDAAGASWLATQICEQVRQLGIPHKASAASEHVTISIGVSSIVPKQGLSPTMLICAADQALYQAETAGRDRTIFRAAN